MKHTNASLIKFETKINKKIEKEKINSNTVKELKNIIKIENLIKSIIFDFKRLERKKDEI